MKRRILIVIEGNSYIRNFITSNIFDHLCEDFELHFSLNEKTSRFANKKITELAESTSYYSSSNTYLYDLIFDLTMWRKRKKSKTFRYRLKRTRGFNKELLIDESLVMKIFRLCFRLARFFFHRTKYYLFANPVTYPFTVFILSLFSKKNEDLLKLISSIKPDLVLYPSSAYEGIGINLLQITKEKKIPSFFLIDNWDNLSSKSILWKKPNRVLVWGEQSRKHAISIQGFNQKDVDVIGAARIDHYFKSRKNEIKSNFTFDYILFVGTTLPFNEASLIYQIDEILTKNRSLFGELKLIYRPHPWRQGIDMVDENRLINTIIDPQLASNYNSSHHSNTFQPNLDYYPSLLKNAEFVMGGLTSMIIESLIFQKKFLAFAYKEEKNLSSPHLVFKNYKHFEDLEKNSSVKLLHDSSSIEKDIIDFWLNRNITEIEKHEIERNYLCFGDDSSSYGKRLNQICKKELEFQ